VADILSHSTVLGTSRTGQTLILVKYGKLFLEKESTVDSVASCPSTHHGFMFNSDLTNRLRAPWLPEEDITRVTNKEEFTFGAFLQPQRRLNSHDPISTRRPCSSDIFPGSNSTTHLRANCGGQGQHLDGTNPNTNSRGG
jgi:hypothetical protein